MLKKVVGSVILSVVFLGQCASAGMLYDFSYDFGGGSSIVGQLEGTLQGDANTIILNNVWANISTTSGNFFADTTADYFADRNAGHDTSGIVSVDGSVMDFILHKGVHGASCGEVANVCIVDDIQFAGGQIGTFNAQNWNVSELESVSAPSAIALFCVSLIGFGLTRRKA